MSDSPDASSPRHRLDIVIASRNRHKVDEIRALLAGLPLRLRAADEVPAAPADVEESGETFTENAVLKATEVARATGCMALADDSGLEVPAIGGEPGVRSARYAGEPADDERNNEKLLERMAALPADERVGWFRCVAALVRSDGTVAAVTEGARKGRILTARRGTGGFGYDPLFYIPEADQTFAEMGGELKNRISHRADAFRKMRSVLLTLLSGQPKAT